MELKYKLSDYCEPLSKTETTKMPKKQMEVIRFIEKIDNIKLTMRQAFHSARLMLLLPIAIAFFASFLYGVKVIYIEPWKKTENEFLWYLNKKSEIVEKNKFDFGFNKNLSNHEEKYIKDGKLSFSDYWDYRYHSGSFIAGDNSLFDLSILLVQLFVSLSLFGFTFLVRNRPPLICDRKRQLFYTWDMKMNVYVAKYSQIEFADIRPSLALFLYRIDAQGNLISHKYYPDLTLFSYLGGGSDNDKAWGLGYITKYLFNGLAPLAESNYTRKSLPIFRNAPIPKDLEQQIQEQVIKVDAMLPPNEEMEARLAESIKQSI
ncbi:hypothetical protein [Providencia stuartii]|uniref:hypothetical protein n=1 Tax=Providencia stuartii TaxID=588 RepID=UPI0024B05540